MSAAPRQEAVATFFAELVEDRFALSQDLHALSDHEYSSAGHTGQFYTIPDGLLDYLPADHATQVEVSLNFSAGSGQSETIRQIHLQPDQGAGISLTNDCDIATHIAVNGEKKVMVAGTELLDDTLRSILPTAKRQVPATQVARAIFDFSPETEHQMNIREGGAELSLTETETRDNTLHTVRIGKTDLHPSGRLITIEIIIQESIKRAMSGTQAGYNVALHAGVQECTVAEIVDGRNIAIKRPTPYHTGMLQAAVEQLIDAAQAQV